MSTEDKEEKDVPLLVVIVTVIFLLIFGKYISDEYEQSRSVKATQNESVKIIEEMPEDLNTDYYQAYSTYIIGRKYSGAVVCNIKNYFEFKDITVYVVPHEETQGQFSITFAYVFAGTNEDRTEWYFKQV